MEEVVKDVLTFPSEVVQVADGVQSSSTRQEEGIPTSNGILTALVAEQQGPKCHIGRPKIKTDVLNELFEGFCPPYSLYVHHVAGCVRSAFFVATLLWPQLHSSRLPAGPRLQDPWLHSSSSFFLMDPFHDSLRVACSYVSSFFPCLTPVD